jgi:hypothetical protein
VTGGGGECSSSAGGGGGATDAAAPRVTDVGDAAEAAAEEGAAVLSFGAPAAATGEAGAGDLASETDVLSSGFLGIFSSMRSLGNGLRPTSSLGVIWNTFTGSAMPLYGNKLPQKEKRKGTLAVEKQNTRQQATKQKM